MGSPLNVVMTCLYMKVMERGKFIRIMGSDTTWCRYVEDVLVIIPRGTYLEKKLRRLNNVYESIQLAVVEEEAGRLPFSDTVIWRSDHGPKFCVNKKPTSKDDFIHFLSVHCDKVGNGGRIFPKRVYNLQSRILGG